ncbi:Gfo/Idh/MocA family oxidoreductase [Jatrophihabitans telluris]|uniref:Gfo/Idh/MocA family oxidoreductase n=1 Tax=Jatrophihabitans telluris TaxID=2038343 RepID=A0ABY4QYT1_9ACTN|nr:Gfo/Idh/MocA family oxidoreductase [Jatrophihabitans telluris]UQX88788.1 Gfo/Idh/MocA family oxidoreductase [Jatrophihabitans telluris]
MTISWGIIGPGRIAANVAGDFAQVPDAQLTAVASRSPDRARSFAAGHDIPTAYGSYRELIDAPDVDVVYIATPHPQHHAIAVAALRAGKAVLVEKAFTATLAGAQDIVAVARETGVFAMEAMWTRFQPAVARARELVAQGAIGEVRSVQADLGVTRDFDPSDRIFAHELGGGATLDLAVYPASFAQWFLGNPDSVTACGSLEPSGVDAGVSILLGYDDGRNATLMTSLHSPMPGHARIFGTTGWIDVRPRFHHPTEIVLHLGSEEPQSLVLPPTGNGYAHEIAEVTGCLAAGRTESAIMPLADSVAVQAILQQCLDQLGVSFAEDPDALG